MASSLSATWTCPECKKARQGTKHQTMTGRTVCGPCQRGFEAAALGMMTGDDLGSQVGNAVTIHGIRQGLRRLTGKKD